MIGIRIWAVIYRHRRANEIGIGCAEIGASVRRRTRADETCEILTRLNQGKDA